MTRIERSAAIVPKNSRFHWNFNLLRSKIGRYLIGGILVVSLLLVLSAKYGMIDVPWLTAKVYQPLQPLRRVAVQSPSETDFLRIIEGFVATPSTPKMRFTEEEISSSYQWITRGSGVVRGLQVVIQETEMEISGRLSPHDEFYRFRILAQPELKDGRLHLEAQSSRFQGIAIGRGLSQPVLNGLSSMFNRQFPDGLKLTELRLHEGEMELVGSWTRISQQ